MAHDTPLSIQNLVIYEVYVRNHGPNGTFKEVENDLERIKGLGVDVVWFMPIHPIGKFNKKGSLGCPYSIADYRDVNPEYGSKDNFSSLINKAHQLGLKVMIDVVYNHTAHDSILVRDHPEWFHQDADGKPVTTVPDWSDVIDLKHPNSKLSDYLIDTLKYWASFGVDGFRCDVASLLPEEFWVRAREEVSRIKPGVIWLAESVHAVFIEYRRHKSLSAISDSELYRAFDLTYDYDVFTIWEAVVKGKVPVSRYLEMLRFQNAIYPGNYAKLRFVENHDQPRIMRSAPTRDQAIAWTAFMAFNKGAFLIYGGQESAEEKTPSLFEIDKVAWNNYELAPFLTALCKLKKHPAQIQGQFIVTHAEPPIQAVWVNPGNNLYGVFNVSRQSGEIAAIAPDGTYTDLLSNRDVHIQNGKMSIPNTAVILQVTDLNPELQPFYSELLEFHA